MDAANTYWDLFAAYTAFWLILALFVYRLGTNYRQLTSRLEQLESELERREKAGR